MMIMWGASSYSLTYSLLKWDSVCLAFLATASLWHRCLMFGQLVFCRSWINDAWLWLVDHGRQGSRRRLACLIVLQDCKTQELFFLFPIVDHMPMEHQAQSSPALLPRYHTKIIVLIREQSNFSLIYYTEKASNPCYHSTFLVFISETEYKQR